MIRNLRGRLYTESYEFVKQQRIKCLLMGDWFPILAHHSTLSPQSNNQQNFGRRAMPNKKWRFYRLSPNTKFLHYNDFVDKVFIRDGVEDLPERSNYCKKYICCCR